MCTPFLNIHLYYISYCPILLHCVFASEYLTTSAEPTSLQFIQCNHWYSNPHILRLSNCKKYAKHSLKATISHTYDIMQKCSHALLQCVPDLSDLFSPVSQTNKPFEFNPSEHTLKMVILKQPFSLDWDKNPKD